MRCLVWFRADLRVDDHRALYEACQAADDGVAALFTICPQQWAEHDWADVRVAFLLENLRHLRRKLDALRVPLLIRVVPRFAGVPAVIGEVVRELRIDAVHANREYEINEQRRDAAVAKKLDAMGCVFRLWEDQCVLPPGELRTTAGEFYTVFTPFKRRWLEAATSHPDVPPVGAAKRQLALTCPADDVPDAAAGLDATWSAKSRALWPAGEDAACDRLDTFVASRVRAYKERRDFPAEPATSRLSPYLTLGVISPRRCLAAAVAANEGRLGERLAGPACWISELIWREFYRHVLVGFPRVSKGRAFKPATDELPWSYDEEHFAAWCAGRTGYPIVDAGMRQLAQDGWMHNRVRMIVAMFLTKDLFIDWRWGERHFMRHLLDGDLASNNGGWQWSASTGTDAAPYFRIFNPFSQSVKFDPDGEYIRAYVPELRDVPGEALHDPLKFPPLVRSACGYPEPIVDHTESRKRVLAAFGGLK